MDAERWLILLLVFLLIGLSISMISRLGPITAAIIAFVIWLVFLGGAQVIEANNPDLPAYDHCGGTIFVPEGQSCPNGTDPDPTPQSTDPPVTPNTTDDEPETPVATQPPSDTGSSNSGGVCRATGNYNLDGLTSLDSAGNYLHVQYWVPGEGVEYETILEPDQEWSVDTHRGGGMVWEYPSASCSFDEVRQQATLSINRRGSQSGGYVNWENAGVFSKVTKD